MGRKLELMDWLMTQRFRHSKGNSEIDFFKNIIISFAVAQMYIKLYLKVELSVYLIILFILMYMGFCWVFGYFWDRWGLYNIEAELGNRRNDFVKEMRKYYHFKGKV